jgi:signal transduction histidine kinase
LSADNDLLSPTGFGLTVANVSKRALPAGIRLSDVATTAAVIAIIELNVSVGGGFGAVPLNTRAYVIGALIALPILVHRRWPVQVLIASFVVMVAYYWFARRNISPAPVMGIPVYDAAVSGYLAWAIAVPSVIMALGALFVGSTESLVQMAAGFLPSVVVFVLAIALGEVVRTRRALAAETASRLRVVEEERHADAARLVAEERLRIARELHDTMAHSMATITVQASSALLDAPEGTVRDALTAIRQTSKDALSEMRGVLGHFRGSVSGHEEGGLDRLPALRDAVAQAGSPVQVTVSGEQVALPPEVDHAAYRILQESLTNVLRHAPARTPAQVMLSYQPDALVITVDNACGSPAANGSPAGNGIKGMTERASATGGMLHAGPLPEGGFRVTATLPLGEAA